MEDGDARAVWLGASAQSVQSAVWKTRGDVFPPARATRNGNDLTRHTVGQPTAGTNCQDAPQPGAARGGNPVKTITGHRDARLRLSNWLGGGPGAGHETRRSRPGQPGVRTLAMGPQTGARATTGRWPVPESRSLGGHLGSWAIRPQVFSRTCRVTSGKPH